MEKNQVSRKHSGGTHACKIQSGKVLHKRRRKTQWWKTQHVAGSRQAAGRQQAGSRRKEKTQWCRRHQHAPRPSLTGPTIWDTPGRPQPQTRLTDTGNRGQATRTHTHTLNPGDDQDPRQWPTQVGRPPRRCYRRDVNPNTTVLRGPSCEGRTALTNDGP